MPFHLLAQIQLINKANSSSNNNEMYYSSLFFALTALLQSGAAHGDKVGAMKEVYKPHDKKPHKLNPAHMRQTRAAPRVINGTDAKEGDYPFFVQAEGCGGSLIWNDIVLTAAHCEGAFYNRVLVGGGINHHQEVSTKETQLLQNLVADVSR